MLFTSQGWSILGKTVPKVLDTARGLQPQAVHKTEGTVFPVIFFLNPNKWLQKEPE